MAMAGDRPNDETLLDYVRGDLAEADARVVEAQAEADPDLAAEIALMRAMRGTLQAETDAPGPGALGWARLNRRLDAEMAEMPQVRRRAPILQLVGSAAAAVLVWQVVAVPLLSPPGPAPEGFGLATEATDGSLLRVAFAPEAPEAAIRALLLEAGARVIDGPSAIGLWTLSFTTDEARTRAQSVFAARPETVSSVQAE